MRAADRWFSRSRVQETCAVRVSVENHWVNIIFPARRRPIAELSGGIFDSSHDVPFDCVLRLRQTDPLESKCGETRSHPGSEILCGELFASDFAQIVVDIT